MPVIKFVKEKKEIEVPEGANLRDEAIKAGVNVNCAISGISEGIDNFVQSFSKYANCHGFGLCGTCRVNINGGMDNTNKLTLSEKAKFKYVPVPDPLPCLAYMGNEETMRLACKTTVHGDIEVETSPALDIYGENFFS
ncbi:MAG: ferredoxin [Bythopirellula sp.]